MKEEEMILTIIPNPIPTITKKIFLIKTTFLIKMKTGRKIMNHHLFKKLPNFLSPKPKKKLNRKLENY
jgi:hypothetical protein